MVNLNNSQLVNNMTIQEKAQFCCDNKNERVVLLHGATGSYADMVELERALVNAGYEVHNWDYPSTALTVKECAEHITQRHLSSTFNASAQKTHFVGFSMGGLVVENIIKDHAPQCLGRVVTLGTPYHGSDVADFMQSRPLNRKYYGFTFGPAGNELTTAFRGAVMLNMQPLSYDLGCISGDQNNAYFVARHLFNGKPNDGRVAVESTKHPYMIDHALIHADHAQLVLDPQAHQSTINFLQSGSFTQPKP
jgi:pimeloyl-ACP methyl ester carboxylesterase|tara:strand:+ start:272 stop:1021 length:750 start_codon:yes stop_codon:yes gene_type:complete